MNNDSSINPFLPAIIFVFILFSSGSADWIHLKNGGKIQGIVEKQNGKYTVKMSHGEMVIDEDRVEKVVREKTEDYRIDQAKRLQTHHQFDDSIRILKKQLDRNPDRKPAREELLNTYVKAIQWHFDKQELNRCKSYVRQGLKQFPDENKLQKWDRRITSYYKSVQSTLSSARRNKRSRNYRKALSQYEKALKKLPGKLPDVSSELSSTHFGRGKKLYQRNQYNSARKHFLKALEFDPRGASKAEPYFAHATLQAVKIHLKRRSYEKARELLKTSLNVSPDRLRLRFLLGDTYRAAGNEEAARREFGRIIKKPVASRQMKLDTLRRKAAKASKIRIGQPSSGPRSYNNVLSGDWRTKETQHFRIYHRNHSVARKATAVAEDYFTKLREKFQIREDEWDPRCKIYIYPSREQYRKNAEEFSHSSGYTRVRARFGRLQSHRILTFQQADRLFQSVLPHELAHVMWKRAVDYRDVPLWLAEGVAVHFEAAYFQKYYRKKVETSLSKQGDPSLQKLLNRTTYPDSRADKSRMYALSYSFVDFLLDQTGWNTLLELGKQWESDEQETLLTKHLRFNSLKDIERYWIRHIRK